MQLLMQVMKLHARQKMEPSTVIFEERWLESGEWDMLLCAKRDGEGGQGSSSSYIPRTLNKNKGVRSGEEQRGREKRRVAIPTTRPPPPQLAEQTLRPQRMYEAHSFR